MKNAKSKSAAGKTAANTPARQPITLSGHDLSPAALVMIARHDQPVALCPQALNRLVAARAVVMQHLQAGKPVYGLTTGLGARVGQRLSHEVLAEFSRLTVVGRSNSLGAPLSREAVRAVMATRLNKLMLGHSGISPEIAAQVMAALNAGFHPVMPAIGSIGASDLCVMGHFGRALIGEGEAEFGGKVYPAAQALARAGLSPVTLGPRDGLALINNSAVSAALAALAFHDATVLTDLALHTTALTMEGFRANLGVLDPRTINVRPAPGQQRAAAALRRLLAGSDLEDTGNAARLQDPVSIRTSAQVHGSAIAALDVLFAAIDPELNGACDNPCVLAEPDDPTGEAGTILSTANFHTPALTLGLQMAGLAMAKLAAVSASRATRLLTGRLTGLPDNLIARSDGRSGYAPLSKVLEGLVQECRMLAVPAGEEQRWGADGVEDDVNATPLAARKFRDLLDMLRYVLAIEAIIAAQAVDLRGAIRLGAASAGFVASIRADVARLDDDRAHAPDVEALAASLRNWPAPN